MRIQTANSNAAILSELGGRIEQAKINQQLTQQARAAKAGVSLRTISVIENDGDLRLEDLIRILRALGYLENLNTLLPELAINPEDYASLGKERQRVSPRRGELEKRRLEMG